MLSLLSVPENFEITLTIDGGVCGILSYSEIITINPLPQALFTTDPAQNITPLTCEIVISQGNSVDILLNGNTLPDLPPLLPFNTDYVEITAIGSDIPGPITIYPTSPLPTAWPSIFRNYQTNFFIKWSTR